MLKIKYFCYTNKIFKKSTYKQETLKFQLMTSHTKHSELQGGREEPRRSNGSAGSFSMVFRSE